MKYQANPVIVDAWQIANGGHYTIVRKYLKRREPAQAICEVQTVAPEKHVPGELPDHLL